jgi:hypothetical protein
MEGGLMTRCWTLQNDKTVGDEDPLTLEEQRLLEISSMLDEAFRRDPSIGAMNRAYRAFRTGDADIDRAIRDHIGLLYLFERARPAPLRAAREGNLKAKGCDGGDPESRVVEVMDRLKTNSASESERSRVEV